MNKVLQSVAQTLLDAYNAIDGRVVDVKVEPLRKMLVALSAAGVTVVAIEPCKIAGKFRYLTLVYCVEPTPTRGTVRRTTGKTFETLQNNALYEQYMTFLYKVHVAQQETKSAQTALVDARSEAETERENAESATEALVAAEYALKALRS